MRLLSTPQRPSFITLPLYGYRTPVGAVVEGTSYANWIPKQSSVRGSKALDAPLSYTSKGLLGWSTCHTSFACVQMTCQVVFGCFMNVCMYIGTMQKSLCGCGVFVGHSDNALRKSMKVCTLNFPKVSSAKPAACSCKQQPSTSSSSTNSSSGSSSTSATCGHLSIRSGLPPQQTTTNSIINKSQVR